MKYFTLALLVLSLFTSCKKSNPGPNIYSLQVTIDGDSSWSTSNVNTTRYSNYTYISATRGTTGEKIDLTITNFSGINTYQIHNTGPSTGTSSGLNTNMSSGEYVGFGIVSGFIAVTGSISVTKVTDNAVYGTFYFSNTNKGGGAASGSFIAPHP